MKAIPAIYENGTLTLLEPLETTGRMEVLVVLPDPDPWEEILRDPTPLPELSRAADEALALHRAGKSEPLDPDDL